MAQYLFSIIIPTYNEERDIARTLDFILRQEYADFEVIVVDDSIDNTSKIVEEYKDPRLKLVTPDVRRGRCEARNIGIKESRGDIIVILNADVLLPSDFLARINKHYLTGYDAVTVNNSVHNMENIYARYVGLHNLRKESEGVIHDRVDRLRFWWVEGFSARKDLIMETSLFPSGFPIPIVAGEDVRFVDELRSLGCRGVFDGTIDVRHVAPDSFSEFWRVRKGRGYGTPQIRMYIDNWSAAKVLGALVVKGCVRLVRIVTLVPVAIYSYRLSRLSAENTMKEIGKLGVLYIVEQIAFSIGEIESFVEILRKR